MRWNGSSLRPTWAASVGNELYTHTDNAIGGAYMNGSTTMPSNNDFNLFENRNEAQDKDKAQVVVQLRALLRAVVANQTRLPDHPLRGGA